MGGEMAECYNFSMPLTQEEVEHIAKLARLELSASELAHYREQLSAILEHVAQLQKLDTSNIPPMAAVFSSESYLRTDVARPSLPTEVILKNAAEKEQGQFKIPPVFE
jgi:aspartyl-tRNA(Asn)/glutamyl-tRNA(Gln) amidotransferase subunit C